MNRPPPVVPLNRGRPRIGEKALSPREANPLFAPLLQAEPTWLGCIKPSRRRACEWTLFRRQEDLNDVRNHESQ